MKKIVFINPPSSINSRYGLLAGAGGVEPPFGLCYMAAAAREKGFSANIIDAQAMSLTAEETAGLAASGEPDFAAVTAVTSSIYSAGKVAGLIKQISPRTTTIAGGCHFTAQPEKTLGLFPGFDLGVVGEGEDTLLELLRLRPVPDELASVKGIVYRSDGSCVRNEKRGRIKDLDSLPFPAFDLLKGLGKLYHVPVQSALGRATISLVTSRGCAGKCGFCDRSVFGNEVTFHGPDYIIALMTYMKERHGIKSFLFEDDNFMALLKGKRAGLLEKLRASGLGATWACSGRVDNAEKGLLEDMHAAGCRQVLYGIESGSQAMLDRLNKGTRVGSALKALELTKASGIRTKGFFIAGSPGETAETLAETEAIINRAALDDISITCCTPYYGTEIYEGIEGGGRLNGDLLRYSQFETVFVPEGLKAGDINGFIRRAYRKFYMKPSRFFDYAARIKSIEYAGQLLKAALGIFAFVFVPQK